MLAIAQHWSRFAALARFASTAAVYEARSELAYRYWRRSVGLPVAALEAR